MFMRYLCILLLESLDVDLTVSGEDADLPENAGDVAQLGEDVPLQIAQLGVSAATLALATVQLLRRSR